MSASTPDAAASPADKRPGQGLAVSAEALYLTNLLLLPGLAFAIELVLYLRNRQAPALALCHLQQTLLASVWVGILVLGFSAIVLYLGGVSYAYTWMFVLTYALSVHSIFVLLGMLGLARAMAGRHFHFPLLGLPCAEAGE